MPGHGERSAERTINATATESAESALVQKHWIWRSPDCGNGRSDRGVPQARFAGVRWTRRSRGREMANEMLPCGVTDASIVRALGFAPNSPGRREQTTKNRRGIVPAMWTSVLGLALLVSLHPVLIGTVVLLVSRPRPMQNLLAYWVAALMVNVPSLLIPLIVLHSTPAFRSFSQDLIAPESALSSTIRHIEIGMGVVFLSITALIAMRSWARQRVRVDATPAGATATLVQDSSKPTAIQRLIGRAQNAWDSGALWVAFVIGFIGVPPPLMVLFVDTAIVASGASIGAQIGAAILFVVGMFAVVEITLVSYLVKPAKTRAVLQQLHDWALAHRRHVLILIFAVAGFWQLGKGMGII